jgi:hypothetical protein
MIEFEAEMADRTGLQDDEELFYLRRFMEHVEIDGLMLGKTKNQKPDALFLRNSDLLGIEIVEAKNTQPKVKGVQRDIAARVFNYVNVKYFLPLTIDIYFNYVSAIPVNEKEEIVNKICSKIDDSINFVYELKDFGYCSFEFEDEPYIDQIRITGFEYEIMVSLTDRRPFIRIPEAGWVNCNPEEIINMCIEKKNSKVLEYRENCDECWLLIYCNPFFEEGHFQIDNRIRTIKSLFDKTYFFDYIKKIIVELY